MRTLMRKGNCQQTAPLQHADENNLFHTECVLASKAAIMDD